ncbi:hypothetical protein ACFLZK_01895 [Patescibacteria group bacterium]
MKKKLIITISLIVLLVMVAGVAVAAFGDKGEVLGSSFTVGSADIKLLEDLANGTSSDNLVDEISGPSFANISPNWTEDYPMMIYNNATTHIQLTSNADYETVNDLDDLRQIIFVEPINWGDSNNDGLVDDGELGSSFGRKTIIKWKTEGYDLSSVAPGGVKGLILRFSTDAVSDTKQGASAIFDFEFDSLGID